MNPGRGHSTRVRTHKEAHGNTYTGTRVHTHAHTHRHKHAHTGTQAYTHVDAVRSALQGEHGTGHAFASGMGSGSGPPGPWRSHREGSSTAAGGRAGGSDMISQALYPETPQGQVPPRLAPCASPSPPAHRRWLSTDTRPPPGALRPEASSQGIFSLSLRVAQGSPGPAVAASVLGSTCAKGRCALVSSGDGTTRRVCRMPTQRGWAGMEDTSRPHSTWAPRLHVCRRFQPHSRQEAASRPRTPAHSGSPWSLGWVRVSRASTA